MRAVVLALLAACTPLYRFELVPPPTGHDVLDARVVATASDSGAEWYQTLEIELRNPSGAPVDVDLAAARMQLVSMIDGSQVTAAAVDGGAGPSPGTRPARAVSPGHVTIAAGATRVVWLAFGGALEPRSRLLRKSTLSLPGAGEIVIDERTAEHPNGTHAFRGERVAYGGLVRSSFEIGTNHIGAAVPFDLGGDIWLGDFRIDLHFGHRVLDDRVDGDLTRTGAFAAGPGVVWHSPLAGIGVYGEFDYERLAPTGVDRENIVVLGGGVTLPIWSRFRGTWRVPIASLRVGWVETYADAGSSGALRFAVEVTPAWLR